MESGYYFLLDCKTYFITVTTSINHRQNSCNKWWRMRFLLNIKNKLLSVYTALYASLFIIAPIASNRIVDIYGIKVATGVILMTIALGLLDVINSNYGVSKARTVIISAIITRITVWSVLSICMFLPVFKETTGYEPIVLTSIRILVAGELSTFIGQYFIDVRLFDYLKRKFNSFFIGYNISNIISQTISLALFSVFAFYGTGINIWQLFVGHIIFRYALQFILSPLFTLLTYTKEDTNV